MALACVTMLICGVASKRLGWAAFGVGGGYAVIIFAQLVLGWREPVLTVTSSVVDLLALIWIGAALNGRRWPSGVHIAGIAISISLVSHPIYHATPWLNEFFLNKEGHNATLAYYLVTNCAMAIACLGLIGSGIADLVARYDGSDDSSSLGVVRGSARVAKRHGQE
jgi:hypothetical protein